MVYISASASTRETATDFTREVEGWKIKDETLQSLADVMPNFRYEQNFGHGVEGLRPFLTTDAIVHILQDYDHNRVKSSSKIVYADPDLLAIGTRYKTRTAWGSRDVWTFYERYSYGYVYLKLFSGLSYGARIKIATEIVAACFPSYMSPTDISNLPLTELKKYVTPPSRDWTCFISLIPLQNRRMGKVINTIELEI